MSLLWVTWAWICALVCGLLKNIGPWMTFWGYVQLFLLRRQMLICSPRHFWTSFQCLSVFAGGWLECGFALLYLAFERIFGHLWRFEGMSSFFSPSSDAHLQPKAFLNIISMSLFLPEGDLSVDLCSCIWPSEEYLAMDDVFRFYAISVSVLGSTQPLSYHLSITMLGIHAFLENGIAVL